MGILTEELIPFYLPRTRYFGLEQNDQTWTYELRSRASGENIYSVDTDVSVTNGPTGYLKFEFPH